VSNAVNTCPSRPSSVDGVTHSPPNETAVFEMPGSTDPEMSFTCGPPVSSRGGGASGNDMYLPSVKAAAA